MLCEREAPRARRIIVEIDPTASPVGYVHGEEKDERFAPRVRAWTRDSTLEEVAERLGLTRQRVQQIEEIALEKIKIAFELEARLGAGRAVRVLTGLRGKSLKAFRATLSVYERSLPPRMERGASEEKGE